MFGESKLSCIVVATSHYTHPFNCKKQNLVVPVVTTRWSSCLYSVESVFVWRIPHSGIDTFLSMQIHNYMYFFK